MKPTNRIKEIAYGVGGGTYNADQYMWAIGKYLDEEWEKVQPCKEHTFATEERDTYCTRCLKPRFTPV